VVQKLQNNYSFYLRQQIKYITFFYQLFTPISSTKAGQEVTKLINKERYEQQIRRGIVTVKNVFKNYALFHSPLLLKMLLPQN
jgi:hypothetical protein